MNYKASYEIDNVYVEFTVTFSYEEGEKCIMHDSDGAGYPGSPPTIDIEKVEVTSVELNGNQVDISKLQKYFDKSVFNKAVSDRELLAELYGYATGT